MAFDVVQRFNFEDVRYEYDRTGDVLYLSFGPPRPAVAVQVEDWLALRLSQTPPFLAGMTIVGFRTIFERINRYIEQELPDRVDRLSRLTVKISYDDAADTLLISAGDAQSTVSLFEPLVANVYVEKTIPSKELRGIKITEYTKCGPRALEAMFGKIVDMIFEQPPPRDENAHLLADAAVRFMDWRKIAAATAA